MNLMSADKEELKVVLAECYNSTEMFCKVFLPDTFHRPFSKLHKQIFEILDDESLQKVVIAAPRGFGKSSILSLAYPAKRILYRATKYVVPISCSADMAMENSENLKRELLDNPVGNLLFGSIKSNDTFSKEEWITSSEIKVKPRGAGQQIRGRRFLTNRPDLILVDDLEDDEGVLSEDQRRKLKNWFFSSVVNSVDRGSKNWRIIVMGTVLHQNSLLSDLLGDSSWNSTRLELCNDQYVSNWPDFMTSEQVKGLADEYRAADMLDVFYREYRNLPISVEDQGFKPEFFKYYEDESIFTKRRMTTIILADIAKSFEKGSCNTAIAGVSVDTESGHVYIREIIEGKFFPDQLIKEMLDMGERLGALIIAPESTGLEEYIMYPLKTEISKRGRFYVVMGVRPREGKTGPRRSGGLVPFYRKGQVFHNKNCCGGLERYLMEWPRPSKWDVIDAVSGLLYVMEEGERYFFAPDKGDDEESYKKIEYEEALDMEEFSVI